MSVPHFRYNPPYPWYASYMSALFEDEDNFLEERIRNAEHELVARERALFNTPERAEERNAIIAALRALAALRTCHGLQRKIA